MATCSKCFSREHLYCMRVFRLEQPPQWYCQDCEPEREATPPICGTIGDLVTTSTFKKSSKVNNDTRQFATPGSSNKGLKKVHFNSFKWERRVRTGRTQYIPVEEALKLPSGSKKSEQAFTNTYRSSPVLRQTIVQFASPVKKISGRQLVNERNHTAETRPQTRVEMTPKKAFVTPSSSIGCGTKVKSGNHAAQSPKDKQPIDCPVDVGYPKSAETKVEQTMKKTSRIPYRSTDCSPRAEVVQKKALSPPSLSTVRASRIISDSRIPEHKGELALKKASPGPNKSNIGAPRMSFGGDVHTNVHLKSSEAEKDNLENVQPNAEQYRGPALDVLWKGSFKMLSDEYNKGLCSGIQGCPPSIVPKKVYEMSKKMPEILPFELIPRTDVWKSIFQDRCPDFDDVGLFFFPSENKRCDNYFTWLEFIGKKDTVMRMCMWGVELLVFTSAHLHKNCQAWHGGHFFWGLFSIEKVRRSMADNRDVFRPCPPNEVWNCYSEGDSRVVDMVIDMEAGMDVGVVDVVKKRESRGDCCGAVGEPFTTTTTNVASAPLALLVVKEEPSSYSPLVMEKMYEQVDTGPLLQTKSPRVCSPSNMKCYPEENASLQIDAGVMASSAKKGHTDIPPGFKELQTLKTAVQSNIPPGFKELPTLKTTVASNIPTGSKEVHTDIPPGFKELWTLKTTVAGNIPPGFETMHTLRAYLETSKCRTFSASISSSSADNLARQSTSHHEGLPGKKGICDIKSEIM